MFVVTIAELAVSDLGEGGGSDVSKITTIIIMLN